MKPGIKLFYLGVLECIGELSSIYGWMGWCVVQAGTPGNRYYIADFTRGVIVQALRYKTSYCLCQGGISRSMLIGESIDLKEQSPKKQNGIVYVNMVYRKV